MKRVVGGFMGFFGLAFLLPGLGLLGGAAFAWLHGARVDQLARSEGEVMRIVDGRPVVAFSLADGAVQEASGNVSSSPPAYEVGERVVVFYDPANPLEIVLDSFFERYFIATVLGGLGLAFTVLGGGIVFLGLRMYRQVREMTPDGPCADPGARAPELAPHQRMTLVRMMRMGGLDEARRYAQRELGLSESAAAELLRRLRAEDRGS